MAGTITDTQRAGMNGLLVTVDLYADSSFRNFGKVYAAMSALRGKFDVAVMQAQDFAREDMTLAHDSIAEFYAAAMMRGECDF